MANELGKSVENERPNPIQSPIAPVIPVADPVEREIMFKFHETGETPTDNIFEHFAWLKKQAGTDLNELNRFLRVHKSTVMWNVTAKAKLEANNIGEQFANILIATTKLLEDKATKNDDVRKFIKEQIEAIKK